MTRLMERCENIIRKVRNYSIEIGVIIVFLSLFILTRTVREQIIVPVSQRSYLFVINWIAYLGILILFWKNILINRVLGIVTIGLLGAAIPYTYSLQNVGKGIGEIVCYLLTMVIPWLLLAVRISDEKRDRMIHIALWLFNVFIVVLFVHACIDAFTDRALGRILASVFSLDKFWTMYVEGYGSELERFYSLLGGPLDNATIFNFFFVLNYAYKERYGKGMFPLVPAALLTVVGASFCRSKVGICVALVIVIIGFHKDIKKLLLVIGCIGGIFIFGFFDTIIYRFQNTLLLTGRAEPMRLLFENFPMYFFHGYGSVDVATDISTAAFEFAAVNNLFCGGGLYMLLMLCVPVIAVIFCEKKFRFDAQVIMWGGLFIEVNTFHGIALPTDAAMRFCVLTFLFINIIERK